MAPKPKPKLALLHNFSYLSKGMQKTKYILLQIRFNCVHFDRLVATFIAANVLSSSFYFHLHMNTNTNRHKV